MKTVGVCTGCYLIVRPGPYFQRRMKRHLNNGLHNHDAFKMMHWSNPPRYLSAKASLWKLTEFFDPLGGDVKKPGVE